MSVELISVLVGVLPVKGSAPRRIAMPSTRVARFGNRRR